MKNIKAIAFDADDTLWVNEPLFRQAETAFCHLMEPYLEAEECNLRLYDYEMQNLPLYGYGIKPFTLSLIEAAIHISAGNADATLISKIIELGKAMLNEPVEVLEGVASTLETLATKSYQLVVATKGDLLDQERKLVKSKLAPYFHHIEIVSDKQPQHYRKLARHLEVRPSEFLMIGNSVKSDILPVLEMGGWAFHIPFHTTWIHEEVKEKPRHPQFKEFKSVEAILDYL